MDFRCDAEGNAVVDHYWNCDNDCGVLESFAANCSYCPFPAKKTHDKMHKVGIVSSRGGFVRPGCRHCRPFLVEGPNLNDARLRRQS